MGVPADRERHGQKQKEPGTGLGKMGPQRKQGNQGIIFARLAKRGTWSGLRTPPSLVRSSRCQKTTTACASTTSVAYQIISSSDDLRPRFRTSLPYATLI